MEFETFMARWQSRSAVAMRFLAPVSLISLVLVLAMAPGAGATTVCVKPNTICVEQEGFEPGMCLVRLHDVGDQSLGAVCRGPGDQNSRVLMCWAEVNGDQFVCHNWTVDTRDCVLIFGPTAETMEGYICVS